jgi:hypothetical protein
MSSSESRWAGHLLATKAAPPSPLLVKALPFVAARGAALDLGAGGLKDTRFLLAEGFERVVAVDGEPTVRGLGADLPSERVEIVVAAFDAFAFPETSFDLVTSQYALPFNPPQTLPAVMDGIIASLRPRGIFCGQLFGLQDEWNVPGTDASFVSEAEARGLCAGLELLVFEERIRDGRLANGVPKHWHVFDIIAKKS